MTGERFEADEYVAVCQYLVKCNPKYAFLYQEMDGKPELDESVLGDKYIGGIQPCFEKHYPNIDAPFYEGYNWDGGSEHDFCEKVLFWYDEDGDYHATTDIDQREWEKNKS